MHLHVEQRKSQQVNKDQTSSTRRKSLKQGASWQERSLRGLENLLAPRQIKI